MAATEMVDTRNANAKRRAAIMAQTTTEDVLRALDARHEGIDNFNLDYEMHLKWAFERAIELARTPADAMRVYRDQDIEAPEEIIALEKALSLCADKQDVEEIFVYLCEDHDSLEFTDYFLKVLQRGKELPMRRKTE